MSTVWQGDVGISSGPALPIHRFSAATSLLEPTMTILPRKLFLLASLIFWIGSTTLCAQVQAINGSIQGDVMDKGGAGIPDRDLHDIAPRLQREEVEVSRSIRNLPMNRGAM